MFEEEQRLRRGLELSEMQKLDKLLGNPSFDHPNILSFDHILSLFDHPNIPSFDHPNISAMSCC